LGGKGLYKLTSNGEKGRGKEGEGREGKERVEEGPSYF